MKWASVGRSALVISTTPPIPREYGNRNRVFQTIAFLRKSGFNISFLLYALDEEWERSIPGYYRELNDQFDYFAIVPNSKRLHQRASEFHHQIDEWWDDNIGQHLTWLFQRKTFDVLFVNYAFLSKAFTFAPRHTLGILDTHDLFTNRRETFADFGLEPEFFYTNAKEETKAFDRAGGIIAIKDSEAKLIRNMTRTPVFTVPYWDSNPVETPEPRVGPIRSFSHDRPLRLGFIGAQNSVNVVNMQRFLARFARYVQLYNAPVEVIVAGKVCRHLHADYPFLRKLGRVPTVGDFYREIDVVIGPLEFSTGIKIKVGEALVWQIPIIATQNAFDGFRAFHPTQVEKSVASLCQSIVALAYNEISLSELVMAARQAARAAVKAQEKGFTELRTWMRTRLRRILFITDRPFWYRASFIDEMVAQAIEYFSHIGPVIVATIGWEGIDPGAVHADVNYVELNGEHSLSLLLDDLQTYFEVSSAILIMSPPGEGSAQAALNQHGIRSWNGRLINRQSGELLEFSVQGSMPILAVPLRYAPSVCERRLSEHLVAVFRPKELSDWCQIVLDYLAARCSGNGIELVSISVPAYAEFDKAFMLESMSSPASRIVVFETDSTSRLFILQAALYRNISSIVIGEGYVFPEAFGPDGVTPSVAQSIENFLRGTFNGQVASGANVGWSAIWASLDNAVS